MPVTGEDRTDHRRIALAPRACAQRRNLLAPPLDLGRAVAFIGEGAEHQTVDTVRLRLREGSRTDAAGGRAVEMSFLLVSLLHDNRHRRLEVFNAARDIGIVAGRAGMAVAVMV